MRLQYKHEVDCYVGSFLPAPMQVVYQAASTVFFEEEDTLTDAFQIAARILGVFEEFAVHYESPALPGKEVCNGQD